MKLRNRLKVFMKFLWLMMTGASIFTAGLLVAVSIIDRPPLSITDQAMFLLLMITSLGWMFWFWAKAVRLLARRRGMINGGKRR